MEKIKIALDWTPNMNHIGFMVAEELGLYKAKNLEVEIISPGEDDYKTTRGKKLELGSIDFALAPFESVISFNNKENKVDAIAVFTIFQEDLSRIVTSHSSNIERPRYLDGKVYASYKARYEDLMVQAMIKSDGGQGLVKPIYREKLGIWNEFLSGTADATWIFDNWEGIEADKRNIFLNKFSLKDYGIPYGYSPVVLTKKSLMDNHHEDFAHFIQATREGYLYSIKNPLKAVNILKPHLSSLDQENIDLYLTLERSSPYFGTVETCGKMDFEKVQRFLVWLVESNLENSGILEQNLFTNELIS